MQLTRDDMAINSGEIADFEFVAVQSRCECIIYFYQNFC